MTDWRHQEKKLRLLNAAQTIPFDITFLDDALIGMMPIDLLLIGARTGRGKTALLSQLALNQGAKMRRVLFFALEADRYEIERRILYRKMSQLFFANYQGSSFRFPRYREWLAGVSHGELDSIEEQAYEELKYPLAEIDFLYSTERMRVSKFVELCEHLRDQYDCIIVDHFHYFIFEGNDVDGVKRAIGQIRDLHLETGKPIILAAQLRKTTGAASKALPDIDDFHGHSDLAKIATLTLLLSPAPQDVVGHGSLFPTWFHCGKSRTASETLPYVGLLTWDAVRNNYSKRYFVGKYSQFDQPELISAQSELPDWAKNGQLAPAQEPTVYGGGRHGRDYD